MTDPIAAAKLALYIILVQPAIYCLFKHGKTGFIGWLYVQIFCVLRIVTGGIGLNGTSSSTGTVILNSIGLSPLLLAASGILHEA
jgi:prolipoprotein diacylglyceryltransferase